MFVFSHQHTVNSPRVPASQPSRWLLSDHSRPSLSSGARPPLNPKCFPFSQSWPTWGCAALHIGHQFATSCTSKIIVWSPFREPSCSGAVYGKVDEMFPAPSPLTPSPSPMPSPCPRPPCSQMPPPPRTTWLVEGKKDKEEWMTLPARDITTLLLPWALLLVSSLQLRKKDWWQTSSWRFLQYYSTWHIQT